MSILAGIQAAIELTNLAAQWMDIARREAAGQPPSEEEKQLLRDQTKAAVNRWDAAAEHDRE